MLDTTVMSIGAVADGVRLRGIEFEHQIPSAFFIRAASAAVSTGFAGPA
jgi:hypothetical protein